MLTLWKLSQFIWCYLWLRANSTFLDVLFYPNSLSKRFPVTSCISPFLFIVNERNRRMSGFRTTVCMEILFVILKHYLQVGRQINNNCYTNNIITLNNFEGFLPSWWSVSFILEPSDSQITFRAVGANQCAWIPGERREDDTVPHVHLRPRLREGVPRPAEPRGLGPVCSELCMSRRHRLPRKQLEQWDWGRRVRSTQGGAAEGEGAYSPCEVSTIHIVFYPESKNDSGKIVSQALKYRWYIFIVGRLQY